MHIHRFFGDFDFSKRDIKIFDKEQINQIKNVLRLGADDYVILCDGELIEANAKIVNIKKDFIELKVLNVWQNKSESPRFVRLFLSVLRRENFEWAVQKAVEVGVKEIIPIITKHTVKLNFKKDRLEKIIKEAAEQSGRGFMPKLRDVIVFEQAVLKFNKDQYNLLFDKNGEQFDGVFKEINEVGIWIGPEGGWEDSEIKIAHNNDFRIMRLGNLILRSETATAIAVFLACKG
ncbi:MAG: RsmE family RNA methyltransferase [Patescibacteria group bacterium]|nr:RsmE family RNA methyltransferase [Patescibacteria group bacterium]